MNKVSFTQTLQYEHTYEVKITDWFAERIFFNVATSEYLDDGMLMPRFTASDIVEIVKLNFDQNQGRIVTPEILQDMKLSKPWARLTLDETNILIEAIYNEFCLYVIDNYNPEKNVYCDENDQVVSERIEVEEIEE